LLSVRRLDSEREGDLVRFSTRATSDRFGGGEARATYRWSGVASVGVVTVRGIVKGRSGDGGIELLGRCDRGDDHARALDSKNIEF
jgi:hypothetical protein